MQSVAIKDSAPAVVDHPNLYIKNLPPNMNQTDVEVLFRPFGPVTGCKFFRTASVPYAFLRLSTPEQAQDAISKMNNYTVAGKVLLVKPADVDAVYDEPNENLYVRGVSSLPSLVQNPPSHPGSCGSVNAGSTQP